MERNRKERRGKGRNGKEMEGMGRKEEEMVRKGMGMRARGVKYRIKGEEGEHKLLNEGGEYKVLCKRGGGYKSFYVLIPVSVVARNENDFQFLFKYFLNYDFKFIPIQ